MPVYDTYSRRLEATERAGQPEVYVYDLSQGFLYQVQHIWIDGLGDQSVVGRELPEEAWYLMQRTLLREWKMKPQFLLPFNWCNSMLHETDTAQKLDMIELSCRIMENLGAHSCVVEMNDRFRENSIGYEYVNGCIVRIDTQYIHAEVVKPALQLLNTAGFTGALEEFMEAHKDYRDGDSKEAINKAGKSFESTMKSICDKRVWAYDASKDTALPLIKALIDNGLIAPYMQSVLVGLVTLRNKTTAAHGQGGVPVVISPHYAAHALHLAASNIVFLVNLHNTTP